jgi:hypothetical protein
VKEFVESQASTQETKAFKRNPSMFSSIRAKKPGDIYQTLMFLNLLVLVALLTVHLW